MSNLPNYLDPDKKTLVVALNYQCFSMWCRRYGIRPYSWEVQYAGTPERLQGIGDQYQVVAVCREDWHKVRNGPRYEMLSSLAFLRNVCNVQMFYDTCIENPPTWEERRAARHG